LIYFQAKTAILSDGRRTRRKALYGHPHTWLAFFRKLQGSLTKKVENFFDAAKPNVFQALGGW